MSYQKTILVANLGRDVEMRYTPNGDAVSNFPVAVSRKWTDAGGQAKEETLWFKVVVWGKQAESCNNYLSKGSKVLIEGELIGDPVTGSPKTYLRKDGTPGASFEIRATTIRFLDKKNSGNGESESGGVTPIGTETTEDSLPF
jgi:single-strand DNA-binding protein